MFTAGMRGAFVALAIWLAGAATAGAESRLALVIGNSAYQTVPALPNPVNDAKAMGEYLKSAGFEVTTVQDATQGDMRLAIGDDLARRGEMQVQDRGDPKPFQPRDIIRDGRPVVITGVGRLHTVDAQPAVLVERDPDGVDMPAGHRLDG